jgi:hypothetical protein
MVSSRDRLMDHRRWHKLFVQPSWSEKAVGEPHPQLIQQDQAARRNAQLHDHILAKSAVFFRNPRSLADNRYSSRAMLVTVTEALGPLP